jgi:hypothetical protein
LVTDSLASGAFAEILAARAALDPELRRKAVVRSVAVALVVVLHILFIAVLLIVEVLPAVRHGAQAPTEIQLVLAPTVQPASLPKVNQLNKSEKRQFEEVIPKPITVLPPELETPKTPEDIMRDLGAELDCGASHYEYLNPAERKLCHRAPWVLPNGHIIAIAPKPQPPAGHMSGAEAATRTRETAPNCMPGLNTPCLDEVIYGKGPH